MYPLIVAFIMETRLCELGSRNYKKNSDLSHSSPLSKKIDTKIDEDDPWIKEIMEAFEDRERKKK